MSLPSFSDAPFHCPPDVVVDLPTPPSLNRIWRVNKAGPKRVSKSQEYRDWIKHADNVVMATAQFRGLKMIRGPFEAHVVLKRVPGDLDNRGAKAIFDYLQSRGVIENDKFCERIVMEWGEEAVAGARVTIKPRAIKTMGQVLRRAEQRA